MALFVIRMVILLKPKKCSTCGLYNPRKAACALTNRKVNPSEDFCSAHQGEVTRCERCNSITLNAIWTPDGDNWHILCSDCASALSTCNFCRSGTQCAFETNPDPLPKTVNQTQRTPFGVTQSQIRNPEREQKFCSTCRCWSTDSQSCSKSAQNCSRHDCIYTQPSWLNTEE